MKRVIIDYKKLTPEILTLLTDKFPDGYGDRDIITFSNHRNETIDAVEVQTNNTIYLVKVGTKLRYSMVNFDSDVTEDVSNALNIKDEVTEINLKDEVDSLDLQDEVNPDD